VVIREHYSEERESSYKTAHRQRHITISGKDWIACQVLWQHLSEDEQKAFLLFHRTAVTYLESTILVRQSEKYRSKIPKFSSASSLTTDTTIKTTKVSKPKKEKVELSVEELMMKFFNKSPEPKQEKVYTVGMKVEIK
jgi:hypothetical protein